MGTYRFIEHIADIAVNVTAETLNDLFVTSVDAYMDAVGAQKIISPAELEIPIALNANEYEYLLVELLSEINYLLLVKKLLCLGIDKLNFTESERGTNLNCVLKIREINPHIDNLRLEIKAVTYHNIKIEKQDNSFSVNIVFDI